MSIRDLAEQIAVTDQETCIESICEEAIEEVEVALHHVHVPKLDQAGYADYDERNRIVGPTKRGRQLDIGIDCEEVPPDETDHVSVDLCSDTLDRLHEVITNDERFDARMTYNAVIGTILADVDLETTAEEERAR
jgi:hypothetical protein